LHPAEQGAPGPQTGAPGSCCTGACPFRPAGDLCRLPAASCDVAESCTGYGGQCPPDGYVPANQCRPTVTLTSGAPPNMSADMAAVLETNAAAAQTYMSGTFNAVRGGAKILNFDANGTQAWVAVLLTNDAAAAGSVGVKGKGAGAGSVYDASPGEQVIVIAPAEDKAKFRFKTSLPATGTIEVVTLPANSLAFAVTDVARPLLINETPRPSRTQFSFGSTGPGVLHVYTCPTEHFLLVECSEISTVPPAGVSGVLTNPIPAGGALFLRTDGGLSTIAGLFSSEGSEAGFATKGQRAS